MHAARADGFPKEPVMPERELSSEVKKLLQTLRQGGLAFNRKEAAENIGKLNESSEALVAALIQAREFDDNEEVRKTAADALHSPAHTTILDNDPGLEKRAAVARKRRNTFPVFGTMSYALAILSVIIVYLDLFILDPQLSASANPLGLGIDPVLINSFFLFVGSFVLPLVGLISGILAVRQYERKTVLAFFGIVGNLLILLATSYAVISR
jgi:hypothetical protein